MGRSGEIWGGPGRTGVNQGEMGRYVEVGGRKEGGALDAASIWAIIIRPDLGTTFAFFLMRILRMMMTVMVMPMTTKT